MLDEQQNPLVYFRDLSARLAQRCMPHLHTHSCRHRRWSFLLKLNAVAPVKCEPISGPELFVSNNTHCLVCFTLLSPLTDLFVGTREELSDIAVVIFLHSCLSVAVPTCSGPEIDTVHCSALHLTSTAATAGSSSGG